MKYEILNEQLILNIFNKVLLEDTSKVKREDYTRLLFKIEDFQNSLNETLKEYRQLQDSLPDGLKTLANGKMSKINECLSSANTLTTHLKSKIKEHKRSLYSQQNTLKK